MSRDDASDRGIEVLEKISEKNRNGKPENDADGVSDRHVLLHIFCCMTFKVSGQYGQSPRDRGSLRPPFRYRSILLASASVGSGGLTGLPSLLEKNGALHAEVPHDAYV